MAVLLVLKQIEYGLEFVTRQDRIRQAGQTDPHSEKIPCCRVKYTRIKQAHTSWADRTLLKNKALSTQVYYKEKPRSNKLSRPIPTRREYDRQSVPRQDRFKQAGQPDSFPLRENTLPIQEYTTVSSCCTGCHQALQEVQTKGDSLDEAGVSSGS